MLLSGIKNAGGDFLHEAAHELENHQAGSDNSGHNDKVGWGKEDEFKEVANKRDDKSGSHDANNSKEEASAEFVERARDPIDEDEVDSEGNKNGNRGELGMRKAL